MPIKMIKKRRKRLTRNRGAIIIIDQVTLTKKTQTSFWERLLMLVRTVVMPLQRTSPLRRTLMKAKELVSNWKTCTYHPSNLSLISSKLINHKPQLLRFHSKPNNKHILIFQLNLSTYLKLSSLHSNSSHIWLQVESTGPQSNNSFSSSKCYGSSN